MLASEQLLHCLNNHLKNSGSKR